MQQVDDPGKFTRRTCDALRAGCRAITLDLGDAGPLDAAAVADIRVAVTGVLTDQREGPRAKLLIIATDDQYVALHAARIPRVVPVRRRRS